MTSLKNILILISYVLILTSCDTNDPPPPDSGNGNGNDKPKPKITLTVDDTTPTEVWLNLITENISLPDTLSLIRNNDTVKTIELFDSSFVIYEDSLLPSQSYSYRAVINDTVTSEATAVTMDTTSHDFTYEIFEFGEHGNSVLRDVAIIGENNIWAVGAVYLKDSTGANDSKLYNAVHWDGSQWNVQRITLNYNDRLITPAMHGIYAFSDNNIWTASGIPTHWDGEEWVQYHLYDMGVFTENDGSVYKVYGSSPNDIYFVGNKGSIAHYNGTSWRKIESGMEMTLVEVFGANDRDVYVSGTNISTLSGILLKGNSSGFSIVKNSGIVDESQLFEQLYGELAALWIDKNGNVYVGGNYLFWQRRGEWNYVTSFPGNYIGGSSISERGFFHSIHGNTSNDYVIAGDRNTIRHFNGINWNQIGMDYNPNSSIDWYAVKQKENIIVAVGVTGNKAIIIKLKR